VGGGGGGGGGGVGHSCTTAKHERLQTVTIRKAVSACADLHSPCAAHCTQRMSLSEGHSSPIHTGGGETRGADCMASWSLGGGDCQGSGGVGAGGGGGGGGDGDGGGDGERGGAGRGGIFGSQQSPPQTLHRSHSDSAHVLSLHHEGHSIVIHCGGDRGRGAVQGGGGGRGNCGACGKAASAVRMSPPQTSHGAQFGTLHMFELHQLGHCVVVSPSPTLALQTSQPMHRAKLHVSARHQPAQSAASCLLSSPVGWHAAQSEQ